MSKIHTIRFYFPLSAKVPPTTFWEKLTGRPLGYFLIQEAKKCGIEQAILHRVSAGFLKDEVLVHFHAEHTPPHMPQCLELVDHDELKLEQFIVSHRHLLSNVKIMKLHGVVPMADLPDEPQENIA